MATPKTTSNTQPAPPPRAPVDDNKQAAPSLWQKLRDRPPPKKHVYLPDSVGTNGGVRCPEHTAVKVQSATGMVPIHANTIDFNSGHSAASKSPTAQSDARRAIAGQSPQDFKLCEKFLLQGLDSGRGLFQFVSRKAHAFSCGRTTEPSREVSIIDQLLAQWNGRGDGHPPLLLGGRYEVTAIEQLPPDEHHRRLILSVRDPNDPGKIITVPLTQAGLKFTGRVLGADQIEQANALLTAHKACLNRDTIGTAQWADDPLIASFAGIGRNAALITYREIRARLAAIPTGTGCDAQWLDANLFDVITTGRRDRGSRFIHSEEQLQELRKALWQDVQQHNKTPQPERSRPMVTSPRPGLPSTERFKSISTPQSGANNAAKSTETPSKDKAQPQHAGAAVVVASIKTFDKTGLKKFVEVPVEATAETSDKNSATDLPDKDGATSTSSKLNVAIANQNQPTIDKTVEKATAEELKKKSATDLLDNDDAESTSSEINDAIANTNQPRKLADQQLPQPESGAPRNAHAARQALFAREDADADRARWLCDYNTAGTMNDRSVEQALVLPSDKTFDSRLNNLNAQLIKSHYRQEISGSQNNCWLRSTWLAVLATTLQGDLTARLRANADETCDAVVENEVAILAAISRLYHRDPAAFAHGTARQGSALSKQRARAAHLHPDGSLNDILQPGTGVVKENITIERFLRRLQLKLVAAYSSDKNPPLIKELAQLQRSHQAAIRDLPIMLHRALGLPILVIQKDTVTSETETGTQSNRSCEISVDVPKGTDLAAQLSGWIEETWQPHMLDERIHFLLEQFSNTPILWLENGHYSLYMPKATAAPQPGDKQEHWWQKIASHFR